MDEVIANLERASAEIQAATERLLRRRNSTAEREFRIKKRLLKTEEIADELESMGLDPALAYEALWAEVVAEINEAAEYLSEGFL